MRLSEQTFCEYETALKSAEHLYLRPRLLHTGNGRVCAFNLTVLPESNVSVQESKPPKWIAVPIQAVCCVLWLGFVSVLGIGFIALGAISLVASGIGTAIRWASC